MGSVLSMRAIKGQGSTGAQTGAITQSSNPTSQPPRYRSSVPYSNASHLCKWPMASYYAAIRLLLTMNAASQEGTVRPSKGAQHPGQEGTISGPKGNRPPPSWLPTFTKPCIVSAQKACLSCYTGISRSQAEARQSPTTVQQTMSAHEARSTAPDAKPGTPGIQSGDAQPNASPAVQKPADARALSSQHEATENRITGTRRPHPIGKVKAREAGGPHHQVAPGTCSPRHPAQGTDAERAPY